MQRQYMLQQSVVMVIYHLSQSVCNGDTKILAGRYAMAIYATGRSVFLNRHLLPQPVGLLMGDTKMHWPVGFERTFVTMAQSVYKW